MFAHVTNLRYWKSERADITTCEDASQADPRRGVFCVADGAGTTLFSNIWAGILVEHFVRDPLVGTDLFEMEWWIRQAQKRYREKAPQADKLGIFARQKAAEQGAYATLATLRFIHCEEQAATAELLAIGDSCALIGQPRQQKLTPFPLLHADDFDRAPYCVPALLKNLSRKMLYAKRQEVTLEPGAIVILATDAVARWIISGGASGEESKAWHAFMEVASKQTDDDWRTFIDACRANQSMVDDDSTALVVQLRQEGPEDERITENDTPRPEMLALRKEEFARALAENNKELVAISYGDGRMLNSAGIFLADADITRAREVADALRDVLQTMRDSVNSTNFAAKLEPTWWRHASLLMEEPCAENIRKSLASQGVRLKRPFDPPTTPSSRQNDLQSARPPFNESGPVHDHAGPLVPQLVGSQSEEARPIPPSALPPSAAQREMLAALQKFRAALATHDPAIIASAYHLSFEGDLSGEERARLQEAQTRLQLHLNNRLREAVDCDDDDAILAVAQAIDSSPVTIRLTESEKKRIQQANEHKAAFEHLQRVLDEGTPHQKVEASLASGLKPKMLSAADQQQLDIAHHLVESLESNNDDHICSAYDALEFSPLRKHFLFTPGDQQRIQQARAERASVEQLRAILQSGNTNVALLLHTYQRIRSPQSFLAPNEQRLIETAQSFAHYSPDDQQSVQTRSDSRDEQLVRLYDELFFSPYRFAFNANETRQVERERARLRIAPPTLMVVNKATIDSTQFLALYYTKPRYASFQISQFRQGLGPGCSEAERQQIATSIAIWQQRTEPHRLPETVLQDLITRTLIEQKIDEEPEKVRRLLEKETQKLLEDTAKSLRAFPARDEQTYIIRLSEQQIHDALLPYILITIFEHYLQTTSGQPLAKWLHERQLASSISYAMHPKEHTPTTSDRQECWLFKWWFLRNLYATPIPQRGESEHA